MRKRLQIGWPDWRSASVRGWLPALTTGVALLLAVLLYDTFATLLKSVRYEDVLLRMAATPRSDLIFSVIATIASYLLLAGYDASALRYVFHSGVSQVA